MFNNCVDTLDSKWLLCKSFTDTNLRRQHPSPCCLSSWGRALEQGLPASRPLPPPPPSPPLWNSPWREQSHEPLMRGFRFASTQPRLELMNKSNEWHVIIGQREWDGQRVGASGRETWNYLSGKICKLSGEQFHFVFFLLRVRCAAARLGPAAHVHDRESDHTHAPGLLFAFCSIGCYAWKKKEHPKNTRTKEQNEETMKLMVLCLFGGF